MRKTPTLEQAERIARILQAVTLDIKGRSFNWGSPENKSEAIALCQDLSGYRPSTHCFSCYLKVVNILATSVGLPPYDHGVTYSIKQRRLEICATCPAYHTSTRSCGRLIVDALNPQPVSMDGENIIPCGCYLPLKAGMKHAKCPANKW